MFSRTAARVTLVTQHEYSYSSVDIVLNMIKSYFFKDFSFFFFFFFFCFVYLFAIYKHQGVKRLMCVNAEFGVVSVSRELFVRYLLG